MDQKKAGAFLKTLRMEKGMTQEQLAENFNVSARTVSRWETGSNMPDLSTLMDLAEFYDLDVREIIDGERKCETMNDAEKETMKKVAEYADAERERLKKKMLDLSAGAFILMVFALLLADTNGFGRIPAEPCKNLCAFAMGAATAILGLNILFLGGFFEKIACWKRKRS